MWVEYFKSYDEKKGFYTSSKYQWWVVVVQCEKFLLSIITSKVLHLQRSATTLIEDHGKIFPKCTYFLSFQLWELKIWLLVVGLKSIWENSHFCASFTGQPTIKVRFAQKVLIVEAWNYFHSVSHAISCLFDLYT